MKKIYFSFMLLSFILAKAQVPTCGYNHAFIASGAKGISPDSAVNFASGTVGTAYTQNITIVVPKDTTATVFSSTQSFTITTINLQPTTNNYNLPPGLSLTGTPSNYKFPGGDSSCMIIYGTPTTPGTYHLVFVLKAYVSQFPGIAVSTDTLKYYKITINPIAGIAVQNGYNFQVMQNSPNPVINTANIKFTAPGEGKVKLSVYNIAGQKLMEKEAPAQRGENNLDFDASTLENGMYLYTLEMNQQKQCRRMVIAR
jgi:hypothetical protein